MSDDWLDAMKAKGHMPYVDKLGRLDEWVLDQSPHNGPGCQVCGWSCCMHCDEPEAIPECDVLTVTASHVSLPPATHRA